MVFSLIIVIVSCPVLCYNSYPRAPHYGHAAVSQGIESICHNQMLL